MVTLIMSKVVVSGATHHVASDSIVVLIAANTYGEANGGHGAFMFHQLLLFSRVNLPFEDDAFNQKLIVCKQQQKVQRNDPNMMKEEQEQEERNQKHSCESLCLIAGFYLSLFSIRMNVGTWSVIPREPQPQTGIQNAEAKKQNTVTHLRGGGLICFITPETEVR